jgi:hypothetical protein
LKPKEKGVERERWTVPLSYADMATVFRELAATLSVDRYQALARKEKAMLQST